jgi:cytochrome c
MLDTMTFTKAGGALCGAFLVFLLGKWAADTIYHVGAPAEGGEEVAQAYTIDTGAAEAPAAGAGDAAAVPYADVMASADAAAGEKTFGKCKSCHKIDGANATGPPLNGVVNRAVGSVADFAYSEAMKGHGGEWAPENLYAFLEAPKAYVVGTKMSFAGLPDPQDRANVIAYLESLGG